MQRMKMIQKLVRLTEEQVAHINNWAQHGQEPFCAALRGILNVDMACNPAPKPRAKKRKEAK